MAQMGLPGGSDGKESTCNAGDLGLILGLGRSFGGGRGDSFQYSCLENPLGQRILAGYSPWGRKESDMTEQLSATHGSNVYPYLLLNGQIAPLSSSKNQPEVGKNWKPCKYQSTLRRFNKRVHLKRVFEPKDTKSQICQCLRKGIQLIHPVKSRTAPLSQLFKLQPRLWKEKVTISEVMVTETRITKRQQHIAENQKGHPINRPSHRTQREIWKICVLSYPHPYYLESPAGSRKDKGVEERRANSKNESDGAKSNQHCVH